MKFSYKGIESGRITSSTIEAEDKKSAVADLTKQGVRIISIEEYKSISKTLFSERSKSGLSGSTSITLDVLLKFFKKLYKMASCGLTLTDAISSIDKRTTNAAEKRLTKTILEDLTSGKTLSESLKKFGGAIDESIYSMMLVGENNGKIADAIGDALKMLESRSGAKKDLIKAIAYPSALLVGTLIIMVGISFFVMPQMQSFIEGMGGKLPATAQFFVSISKNMYWILPAVACPIISIIVSIKTIRKTEAGKYSTDSLILKLPIFGNIATLSFRAGLSNLMATLLGNGVNITESLKLAEISIKNRVFLKNFQQAKVDILDGKEVYRTFEKYGIFDGEACDLLQVGEKIGDLASSFQDTDKMYAQDLSSALKRSTKTASGIAIAIAFSLIGMLALGIVQAMLSASSGAGGVA